MTFDFSRLMEMIKSLIPQEGAQLLLVMLILIMTVGLIGGLIAKKLKQPLILGYIIAGCVAALFPQMQLPGIRGALTTLADIGVALLLFSMGLEFSKKDIRPVYKVAVWGSLAQVLFTLLTASVLGYLISRMSPDMFPKGLASWMLFGTAFVSTSTAVLLKTLTSKRRMGTLSSKVMIGISIVQDLTVMPIMLLITQLDNLKSGFMAALGPLVCGGIYMALMMTVGAKYIPKYLKFISRFESRELFLLSVTGLALLMGMAAEVMKVSFSFGAFLAGIVLSDSDYGKKALSEMSAVRDLFAMLFFVSIGLMLDFHFFVVNWKIVLLLVVLTGLSRTVFLSGVTYCSGYRNVIPVAMLFGMFPTSEMAFVVIQTAQQHGFFSQVLYSLVLCVVVCSMILGPCIDSLTSPVYAFLRKTIWKNMGRQDIVLPMDDLSDHVIIAGGGTIARSIAMVLTRLQMPYLIIETDHVAFRENRERKLTCLYGDPQQDIILTTAGIDRAQIMLLASSGVEDNISIIRRVRELNPKVRIVARADSPAEVEMLHNADVQDFVQPLFEAGLELTRQALLAMKVAPVEVQNYIDAVRYDHYKPLLEGAEDFSTVAKMRSFAGLVALTWIKLPPKSPFENKSIAESQVRSLYGVSVVGILHEGKFISNPSPSHKPEAGDILALIGTAAQQTEFAKVVGTTASATPAAAEHDVTA